MSPVCLSLSVTSWAFLSTNSSMKTFFSSVIDIINFFTYSKKALNSSKGNLKKEYSCEYQKFFLKVLNRTAANYFNRKQLYENTILI